jgi:hypothetical protein
MSSVFNEYPVSGVGPYSITFEYQTKEDVFVLFENPTTKLYEIQPNTSWSFENATTIQLVSAPSPDIENVRVQRVTDVNPLRALFYPGSAIRAQDLNANFEQLMMAIEERSVGGGGEGVIPGDGTITINQGGSQKGSFTVNQSGDTTINLDAGGSGGGSDPDLSNYIQIGDDVSQLVNDANYMSSFGTLGDDQNGYTAVYSSAQDAWSAQPRFIRSQEDFSYEVADNSLTFVGPQNFDNDSGDAMDGEEYKVWSTSTDSTTTIEFSNESLIRPQLDLLEKDDDVTVEYQASGVNYSVDTKVVRIQTASPQVQNRIIVFETEFSPLPNGAPIVITSDSITNGFKPLSEGDIMRWDAPREKWTASALSVSASSASPFAPVNPNEGDLWYSTTDARLYVYFDDGNTEQWADASPALASGVTKIVAGNNVTISGDGTGEVTINSSGGGDGSGFSGDYNDLTNKPSIPSNNTELTNGANYITAAEAPVQPSDIPTVPTTVSSFTNDSNYITAAEAPVQPDDVFSGSYNDLTDKPSIPTVDPNTVVTDEVPTFTVAVQTTERTITAGSFDLASGNHWTCGAITVPNPSNCVAGTSGLIRITAGPVVWGSYFKFPSGSAPTIASFPAIIPFYVQSASVILLGNVSEGIS